MSSTLEIQAILAALGEGPAGLATLIAVNGSSYRQVGARCLVSTSGRITGSISGGCLEEDVRLRATRVLNTGEPEVALYDTATENDMVWGTGLGCQGQVTVFFERLQSPPPVWIERLRDNIAHRRATGLRVVYAGCATNELGTRLDEEPLPRGAQAVEECIAAPPSIVIFGAGDDAIPLVEFGHRLGWHISVLDTREAYATRERFPHAHVVSAIDPGTVASHPSMTACSHVIVMSHRYRDDAAFVRAALSCRPAYLGVLGPRHRTHRILDELASNGSLLPEELKARIYAPVGLDLGGAAPETVALSIVAELQAVQQKRTPQHLRDSVRPIHG
jgi:xanthine/CO dehydrogenase XdhC/CoxF family maturation factor